MKKIILPILVFLILVFIWSRSAMPKEVSAQESGAVLAWVNPFLELFLGEGRVTINLVRKLAHFGEFAVLGGVLALWLETLVNGWGKRIFLSCNFGFYAAFVDETIQIFAARGPQIRDVWLDLAGAVTAVLVVTAVLWALDARKKRVCHEQN